MKKFVLEYLESLNKQFKSGLSTEHSFRGDLQNLLTNIIEGALVTNEPKRIQCGAPDYIITKNKIPLGYIEAKDLGANLDDRNYQEQFNRYKNSLPNLIITNYLDFCLYREGSFSFSISIGKIDKNKIIPLEDKFEEFVSFIKDFGSFKGITIRSAEKLAKIMAGKAKMMAYAIERALNEDEAEGNAIKENQSIRSQYLAFKKVLMPALTAKEFSDIYAQTIAYGMFAARIHDPSLETFTRYEAAELIPKTNPFLRKMFQFISGYDLDSRIAWMVDDLAEVFRSSDAGELIKNFRKESVRKDPVIHFYETFLSEYDKKLRKSRGVYYTPSPVVNFIVKAVDDVLKNEFQLKEGIADSSKITIKAIEQEKEVHRIQILDPATGTGTFLAEITKYIYEKFKGQEGVWSNYVENHLIPRLNGFEILMASYAMAHLKLDLLLAETNFKKSDGDRFRIFLTNSLEDDCHNSGPLFAYWLGDEAEGAAKVKRETPVMVVIGNPPYSGESQNKGKWIMNLMEDYKKEPEGKIKLKEKNPKWINDDYVKFIRFGQYFIKKNSEGILAFINNHSFLDNPTFRGMRWNLLKDFDKIFIIDLHGNAKKKEISPDGSKDENVFDIQQGVSINIFVKSGKKKEDELGEVFHFDLYGKREEKYKFLLENSLSQIPFEKLQNKAPMYYFVQKDYGLKEEYEKGFKINELFPAKSVGIVTARDEFCVHEKKEDLKKAIEQFLQLDDESARAKFKLGKDVRDWKVRYAKKDLNENYPQKGSFAEIAYRPFDNRWTFFTGQSRGFHCYPRTEIAKHFINRENLGVIFKLGNQEIRSASAFIAKKMIDFRSWSRPGMQGGDYIAPLYLYPDKEETIHGKQTREPNLKKEIVEKISEKIGLKFSPEKEEREKAFSPIDILDYIYAVLHSLSYRDKYKEFLKTDFPIVPYPETKEKFLALVKFGERLRKIHLLEEITSSDLITSFPIDGSNIVEKVSFENGRVWINEGQYFDNVPEESWNFYIGGYQPAQKWLKDRKGKKLSFEQILHYQKIILALHQTHKIMEEIEETEII